MTNTSLDSIRDYYEHQYPLQNPDLDVEDVKWKMDYLQDFLSKIQSTNQVNSVVSIGCGSAKLLEQVRDFLGCNGMAVGVDISLNILRKAKVMSPNVTLVQGRAEELAVAVKKVDLIYFVDLLEHLPDPEIFLSSLQDAKNLLMLIPLESGWLSDLHHRYRKALNKPTNKEIYGHLHRWNRQDCLQMIEDAGLHLEQFKVCRGKVCRYSSLRGKLWFGLSELVFHLSQQLHEKLFGGYTFVALCKKPKGNSS